MPRLDAMNYRLVVLLILVMLGLFACGSDEQAGVALQPAGQYPAVTPTVAVTETPAMPSPAPALTGTPAPRFAMSGRLLVLKGGQFLLYDLQTEEITPLPTPRANSPAALSADARLGAFVAFPDFAVFDLTSGETRLVNNPGSIPTGLALSPDGNWLATLTGTITVGLRLISTTDGSLHNVASSSQHPIAWAWTTDSRLAWWWSDAVTPEPQVFDPVTGQSVPLGEVSAEIAAPPEAALSPDGKRAVIVPVASGPAQPETCFDSYVGLLDVPFATAQGMNMSSETIWTEPGLVASSPQWLDDDTLLFVKLGVGTCGQVSATGISRQVMALELAGGTPQPLAGPLGNADDPNDRVQQFRGQVTHLYSPSPDDAYIAWIGGGVEQGETLLNITELASGQTVTLLRFTRADAQDMADFIENHLLRQVVWLP
ncbi:MAG: hypothetical protein Kow00106_16910 [Anaerolineae bacterium]